MNGLSNVSCPKNTGWPLVGNEGINLYIGILGMKLPSFRTKGQPKKASDQLLQVVTKIDPPNGGHVFSPEKGHKNGSKRCHFEEPGQYALICFDSIYWTSMSKTSHKSYTAVKTQSSSCN